MSSQSWTSWLLDSYASSVHPSTPNLLSTNGEDSSRNDAPEDLTESPMSTTSSSHARSNSNSNSATSPTPSGVPYGFFLKSGRGGAGNFPGASEQTPDGYLESQNLQKRQSSQSERQRAAALTEHLKTSEAVQASSVRRKKAEFLRVGIGGAGNLALTQSNEVQSPRSPSFARTPFSSAGSGQRSAGGHGRGGAGNFVAPAEAERHTTSDKEEEERRMAELTRQKVEAEVDGLVKVPEGAVVSHGRSRDS